MDQVPDKTATTSFARKITGSSFLNHYYDYYYLENRRIKKCSIVQRLHSAITRSVAFAASQRHTISSLVHFDAHATQHMCTENTKHTVRKVTRTPPDFSTGRAAVHISHNTIMVHLSNFPPCSSCSRQNTENYICKEDSTAQRTGSSSGLDERRKSRRDWLSRHQRRPSSVVVFFLLLFLFFFFFFFCFGGLEVVLLPSAGSL